MYSRPHLCDDAEVMMGSTSTSHSVGHEQPAAMAAATLPSPQTAENSWRCKLCTLGQQPSMKCADCCRGVLREDARFEDEKSAKSAPAAATGGARQLVRQSCAALRACSCA